MERPKRSRPASAEPVAIFPEQLRIGDRFTNADGGFVLLGNWRSVPELVILHAWLDTWFGLGAVVVGMERHGYDLWLAKDRNGWRSTFLHRSHVVQPWIGQVLCWCPTPWRAVQEAAWRALSTPFARDYR